MSNFAFCADCALPQVLTPISDPLCPSGGEIWKDWARLIFRFYADPATNVKPAPLDPTAISLTQDTDILALLGSNDMIITPRGYRLGVLTLNDAGYTTSTDNVIGTEVTLSKIWDTFQVPVLNLTGQQEKELKTLLCQGANIEIFPVTFDGQIQGILNRDGQFDFGAGLVDALYGIPLQDIRVSNALKGSGGQGAYTKINNIDGIFGEQFWSNDITAVGTTYGINVVKP